MTALPSFATMPDDDLLAEHFDAQTSLVDHEGQLTDLGILRGRLCFERASDDRGRERVYIELDVPFGHLGTELTVGIPTRLVRRMTRWVATPQLDLAPAPTRSSPSGC